MSVVISWNFSFLRCRCDSGSRPQVEGNNTTKCKAFTTHKPFFKVVLG